MDGHVFVSPGDITQLAAHAIAYSASTLFGMNGSMYAAFRDNVPGFAGRFEDLRRDHAGRAAVGDAFWIPARAHARPHGVVVAVAAGGDEAGEGALAVRASLDLAVASLRAGPMPAGRLLIALPAFLVGMGGGGDRQLGAARAQIAAAVEALRHNPGVDAAFITYTPTLHRAFLSARRDVVGGATAVPDIPPGLERALIERECVLFAGAGLSRGAGLPDWAGLIGRMAAELGLTAHGTFDPLDLAQWYREEFGRENLARLIGETFADPAFAPRPTLAHYLAMSVAGGHVITTNYDDLLERTLAALKRHPVAVIRQEDVAGTGRGGGVHVVKLHGDASRPAEIVLCRDDYAEFFERRPAMALLLEGLMLNRTFLFLGYGLRDINFRQLYGRVGRMLREAHRPAFATSFESAGEAGAYVARQWAEKGLHLIDVPGATGEDRERNLLLFLDRLADRVTSASPRLLLASDAKVVGPMATLRELLLAVGEEVAGLCRGSAPLSREDVGPLANVLDLLAHRGWRPSPGAGETLCGLFERLADLAGEVADRRRLLIAALEMAEGAGEANRMRGALAVLEGDARA